MLRPLKLATPLAAVTVLVPLKVPEPGLVPMDKVTVSVLSVVTTLPLESSMATLGAGVMEDPATVVVGWVKKTNWLGKPGVMLKALLVAAPGAVELALK